ncbi:MAG: protein jag [Jatrophihabitans sp.]|nr:MAG: protein jag [Jatrophihabitans sp.]
MVGPEAGGEADGAADGETDGAAGGGEADGAADGRERPGGESGGLLVREGDIAADYLERLLDIIDFDGDIDLDVENDRAVVAIVGSGLRSLIGPKGETLDALQDLTRLAVTQQTGQRSRLMLDVSGYRQGRRAELVALATETAARVLASGEPARLAAMNPFERKMIHDAISAIDGVHSESEGVEPARRVVVLRDA